MAEREPGRKVVLYNKHTQEEILLGYVHDDQDITDEILDKAKEIAGIDKIYYTRIIPKPTGEWLIDFGSYTWFIKR